jgi:hypothetical protein
MKRAHARPSIEPITIEIGCGICIEMNLHDSLAFTRVKIESLRT